MTHGDDCDLHLLKCGAIVAAWMRHCMRPPILAKGEGGSKVQPHGPSAEGPNTYLWLEISILPQDAAW